MGTIFKICGLHINKTIMFILFERTLDARNITHRNKSAIEFNTV